MNENYTSDPEKMCSACLALYEKTQKGPVVLDYLVICGHKGEDNNPDKG